MTSEINASAPKTDSCNSLVALVRVDTVAVVDQFEPLTTKRLRLEPITLLVARLIAAGDVDGLGAAEGWPQPGTKNGVAHAIEHGHPAGWLVRLTGGVIGGCGTKGPIDDAGGVEIGYGLASPFWGQGLGTEVVVAISDWLLAQPGVSTVRARTAVKNIASRRVLEKAGFTSVGTTEKETLYERHSG